MQVKQPSIVLFALSLLTACGGSSTDYNFDNNPVIEPAPAPAFSPADGGPMTNNLLFAGTTDGTLNIPNTSNNPLINALNTLDGFSTTNPITSNFNTPLDTTSLTVGTSIRIFEVSTTAEGVVDQVLSELGPQDVAAQTVGAENKTLALIPLKPLKESSTYMVLLTRGIQDQNGTPVNSSGTYLLLKGSSIPDTATPDAAQLAQLKALQPLVNAMEAAAASEGVDKNSIVLSWSFTTQSITPVLNSVAASAKAERLVVVRTGMTTRDINAGSPGLADIYIGTLEIPYYLEASTTANPMAPLTGYWKGVGGSSLTRFNPSPVVNTTLTIPVMMTVPNNSTRPGAGWPIVMYQHGITRVRTDAIVYADTMAQAGFAVIAIDLPLHGAAKTITTADGTTIDNPFHASQTTAFNETELTFDLDLVNNDTGAAGSDGNTDSSGTHFINLQSLLTSRDNVKQGVSNLLTLRRSLVNIINLGGGVNNSRIPIDTNRVGFIAHSLGGVIGVTYLGVESPSLPSSLVTTGAPIIKILDESVTFGPRIKTALAAAGIEGDALVSYFQAAQFITDSADPINFAQAAAEKHPIHLIEIANDQTVPNSTTEILAALLGAKGVSATVTDIAPSVAGIVRFSEGAHSSPLDPSQGLNVFTEIHSQLATFQATGGTTILVNDSGIIQ